MTGFKRASNPCCALETSEAQAQPAAVVGLVATVALALSTVIAVTAVSIGIARADVFALRPDTESAPLAVAVLIGLLLSAMGGLTAAIVRGSNRRS